MTKTPRVSQIGKECVACGTCVPVCPKEAIQIRWGVSAHVDEEKCVGCPAAVINMVERGGAL